MHTSPLLSVLALLSTALSSPILSARQNACFVIGSEELPAEVSDVVTSIESDVTCDDSVTTLSNVPDVISGGINFSSINFADSNLSPLDFALTTFATADPVADSDLQTFQDRLNTYLATEAGIRSVGGSLDIKVPKFFLSFQIARIKTAQGTEITDAGETVEHLLGKVTKNGADEDAALLDQVTALSTQLS